VADRRKNPRGGTSRRRANAGDFTTTRRVLPLSLLALAIGVVCAFVSQALLALIGLFTNLFYFHRCSFAGVSPNAHHLSPAVALLAPVGGGIVIGMMARFGSDKIRGHGIPEALEAILQRGSRVQPRVAVLKPVSAAISIGSGGPFGAEGPIIVTGGSLGSLLGQLFSLSSAERKTLLVAGAAAGMSATFASPVAALVLAIELLLFELKPRSFIPVAIASATAAAVRYMIQGPGVLFAMAPLPAFVGPRALLACLAVGILGGALSACMTAAVYACEDAFARLPIHWMWWPALGGLVVGTGGLLCPEALGVGYERIHALLSGDVPIKAMALLAAVKFTIWAVSLGSGTSGGVLAPVLMLGCTLGGLGQTFLPPVTPGFWPLVGMGATLAGTMGAPLTAVVFALELTGDGHALLPVLLAGSAAYAFTVLTLKRSILTEKLARRGQHISREYAVDALETALVREVMREAPSPCVAGEEPLAYADEPVRLAIHRMIEHRVLELPVFAREPSGGRLGLFSVEDALKARQRHHHDEHRRDRTRLADLLRPVRSPPKRSPGHGS